MKRVFCFFLLALALLVNTNDGFCAGHWWPEMAEFSAEFGVETSAERILFKIQLIDVNGQTRYTFICIGGSEKYLDHLSDTSGTSYVGPLACGLVQGQAEQIGESLLSEDDSAHWYSRRTDSQLPRANRIVREVPGIWRAASLPDREAFELTLYFGDVEVDKTGNPTYFTLTVSLRRDASITSPQAEQPGYLTPYKVGFSCDKVLKGNEPRMCRDWKNLGGSWTECSKLGR